MPEFDPREYITTLTRRQKTAEGQWRTVENEYLEVKYRLLWLRTEHPDAAIKTKLKRWDTENREAFFRATVTIPGGGSATGWGSETAADWKDALEKAETKALGRALAALGYGTQFCDDWAFADADHPDKVVDAPVSQRATASTPKPTARAAAAPSGNSRTETIKAAGQMKYPDRPAEEPQIAALYAVAPAKGMSDGELEEWVKAQFGGFPGELTRQQAHDAAVMLAGMPAVAAAAPMTEAAVVAAASGVTSHLLDEAVKLGATPVVTKPSVPGGGPTLIHRPPSIKVRHWADLVDGFGEEFADGRVALNWTAFAKAAKEAGITGEALGQIFGVGENGKVGLANVIEYLDRDGTAKPLRAIIADQRAGKDQA